MIVEKEVNPRFEDFLFDWNHKNYFLVGGYGSSKSYHVALKIVLKLLEEKRKCLVIREVYETMKESCFALFVDIIEDLGLSDTIRVTESPMKIKFPSGSTIIFRGMDKPAKLKSVHNVSMVWLEEASEIKYEGFKEVKKRMRHPTLKLHMILSTNPVSIDNWVYLHFFKDEANERIVLDDEDLYEKHTVVVKDTYYHHSTADDNLFLSQSYIDELDETKEYDPDMHRVARYGKFGVNGVKVLPQFEMMDAENMDEIIKNQRKLMLRVGMDFGFETSYNAVVRMAIDHEKKYLYLYWEYYKNKQTDPQTAKDLIEFKESGEHIKADSAEPKTIAYFRQKGFEMEIYDELSKQWIGVHWTKNNRSQAIAVSAPWAMADKCTKIRSKCWGSNLANKQIGISRVMMTSTKYGGKAYLPYTEYARELPEISFPPTLPNKKIMVGDQDDVLLLADKRYKVNLPGAPKSSGNIWAMFSMRREQFCRWTNPTVAQPAVIEIDFSDKPLQFLESIGIEFGWTETPKNIKIERVTSLNGAYIQLSNINGNISDVIHVAARSANTFKLRFTISLSNNQNTLVRVNRIFATTGDDYPKVFVNTESDNTVYGDLRFGDKAKGPVLPADDGSFWRVSIDSTGNLKTTKL